VQRLKIKLSYKSVFVPIFAPTQREAFDLGNLGGRCRGRKGKRQKENGEDAEQKDKAESKAKSEENQSVGHSQSAGAENRHAWSCHAAGVRPRTW